MTPRRPIPLILTTALTGVLALVGDAGATTRAAPRHATAPHTAALHASAQNAASQHLAAPAVAVPATTLVTHPASPTAQTTASFTFTASQGATTTCSLDGSAPAACAGHASYTGLRSGTHTFALRAASGAQAKVASYSWSVDTTTPSVPAALTLSAAGTRVTLAWHAAGDPDSTVAYAVYRNSARIGQTSTPTYVDPSAPAGASYAVAAYDPAGNTSATSAAVATTTTSPQPLGVAGTWTLKFDDEFSGTSLDQTKWQPNWLASNNKAITTPPNSMDLNCEDPAQVSESSGVLHLVAAARSCRVNGHTYSYAGGLVNTYNSYQFTYGYTEARIYIPANASGVPVNFPAFWADGTGTWPSTGELDVMEVLGACGPGLGFHFHSSAGAFGGCAAMPVTTGWHTFGADWQAGAATFYYDGTQVGQITTGITSAPMYLILDHDIDPTYGGPTVTPADLQVDYVRAWQ